MIIRPFLLYKPLIPIASLPSVAITQKGLFLHHATLGSMSRDMNGEALQRKKMDGNFRIAQFELGTKFKAYLQIASLFTFSSHLELISATFN